MNNNDFKSYFLVIREMFAYILNFVKWDLTTIFYNRVRSLITVPNAQRTTQLDSL